MGMLCASNVGLSAAAQSPPAVAAATTPQHNPVASAQSADASNPPSFVEDVIPLLTRLGCNQGACHGKNDGRNGFRLSLRGYAPELDIERLTRESRGRRVDLALPEQSLMLRKPTGMVPHGGGTLLEPGSREYKVLLAWLKAGAPGPLTEESHVERIELTPANPMLRISQQQLGQQQPMQLRARYTDGHWRDVTWLTQFATNDANVVEITPAGLVHAKRQGEATVRAHFRGQVAVATITIPFDTPVDPARLAQRNNFIDEHVFNKLAALRIPPAELCSDSAFLRRASLDTIGALPTPDEVRSFLADSHPDKRARAIDRLLARPEFVDYWTLQWSDLLQNRKERDHDVRGAKGVHAMQRWLREQVAVNRSWDEMVRDLLTVSGKSSEHPEVGYYIVNVGEQQGADRSELVSAVAQAFLGTRIGCAKCHNHPLEKYTQDDYYHFAAYFSAIKLDRVEAVKGPTTLSFVALKKDQKFGTTQPRTGKFLGPQTFDGIACSAGPNDDPRVKLAAWITDPKNAYFSGAMVNRLWSHFLNVGLVEPVDDLRASNPPTNAELWRALNQEFVDSHYDIKHMIRLILNSRTYQLSSASGGGNEADTRFYSHYFARRLPAEVLLDAVCQATGVPERYDGYPLGARAVQLADPTVNSYFLSQFGRPERVTPCVCERRSEVTITQLLELSNSDELRHKTHTPDGRLSRLLKEQKDNQRLTSELFLLTLSREPTVAERKAVDVALAEETYSPSPLTGEGRGEGDKLAARAPLTPNPSPARGEGSKNGSPAAADGSKERSPKVGEGSKSVSRDEVFQDLFWALLNSKEFVFNH
jgi:hypothetical protein